MKKVGVVFVSIYLTITTICSVLFGWLYLSNLTDNKGLSISSASELVNAVCYDMGLISEEEYIKGAFDQVAMVSRDLLEYQPFTKDSISEADYKDANLDLFGLKVARYILANEFKENTNYRSQFKEINTLGGAVVAQSDIVYDANYSIEKNTVTINYVHFGSLNNPQYDWMAQTGTIVITKTGDTLKDWELVVYNYAAPEDLELTLDGETADSAKIVRDTGYRNYQKVKSRKEGIYYYEANTIGVISDDKAVNGADDLSQISMFEIDVDTEKQRNIFTYGDDVASYEKLDELLAEINDVLDNIKEETKNHFKVGKFVEDDFGRILFAEQFKDDESKTFE